MAYPPLARHVASDVARFGPSPSLRTTRTPELSSSMQPRPLCEELAGVWASWSGLHKDRCAQMIDDCVHNEQGGGTYAAIDDSSSF